MPDCLIDTNVLVYAVDRVETQKRAQSQSLLGVFGEQGGAVLSAQVLGEFFHVVTKRIRVKLTSAEAAAAVAAFSRVWPVHAITRAAVIEATTGVTRHQLSYWDALLWATAKLNSVDTILSEDFQHGRLIEGVRVLNPFHSSFELDSIIR